MCLTGPKVRDVFGDVDLSALREELGEEVFPPDSGGPVRNRIRKGGRPAVSGLTINLVALIQRFPEEEDLVWAKEALQPEGDREASVEEEEEGLQEGSHRMQPSTPLEAQMVDMGRRMNDLQERLTDQNQRLVRGEYHTAVREAEAVSRRHTVPMVQVRVWL